MISHSSRLIICTIVSSIFSPFCNGGRNTMYGRTDDRVAHNTGATLLMYLDCVPRITYIFIIAAPMQLSIISVE